MAENVKYLTKIQCRRENRQQNEWVVFLVCVCVSLMRVQVHCFPHWSKWTRINMKQTGKLTQNFESRKPSEWTEQKRNEKNSSVKTVNMSKCKWSNVCNINSVPLGKQRFRILYLHFYKRKMTTLRRWLEFCAGFSSNGIDTTTNECDFDANVRWQSNSIGDSETQRR